MSKIITKCPVCGHEARTVSTSTIALFGGITRIQLTCGHSIVKRDIVGENVRERDELWNELFPFQKEGIEFIEKAGYRALIGDEMGLGKTVQALMTLRYHPELLPALYITRSAVKYQWQKQIMRWMFDPKDWTSSMSQVIETGNCAIMPLKHTIISMDMLEKFKEDIIKRGFKTVIIDESQNFKSMTANRTSALFDIVREMRPESVLCLSGTPVLNRASEFFTTLNLIRPEHWRTYEGFVRYWCDSNYKGTNVGPILWYKREQFHEMTKNYIIRREKREVMKDLPAFRRDHEWFVIEDERIKDAYNTQLKALKKHLQQMEHLKNDASKQIDLLGYLEKMRQLCALAKIPWTIEYVESFFLANSVDPSPDAFEDDLQNETPQKLIIGLHHEVAIEALSEAFECYKPIIITGKDNAQEKERKKNLFINDPSRRLMIASILAAGEGLDGLQHVCSNMLTLERMWNLSKERQFEARIDRYGQKVPVRNVLLLAKGTVDEYFTELILEKESYVTTTVAGKEVEEEMAKHYKALNFVELAQKCVEKFI